jgi:hypothetical protein
MVAEEGVFFEFGVVKIFAAEEDSRATGRGREAAQRGHQ